jgi:branched-chain amino acid transport system permease protein
MLITFGLSLVLLEAVQLVWGTGPVNYRVPAQFDGVIWRIGEAALPAYRVFIMAVAVLVLLALAAWLRLSSVGLVIKAALTHPQMVQALGHDLPRVLTSVFALGCALAALAGVLGGNARHGGHDRVGAFCGDCGRRPRFAGRCLAGQPGHWPAANVGCGA